MNPLDYRTHMDSYSPAPGLDGLIGAAATKSDKADKSVESPSEARSFADAVNGADTEKRAERTAAPAKTAPKQVQKSEPKSATADKAKAADAAKVNQSEGSTSQDYVAAYGSLVPADTTENTKGGTALSSLAGVKPEHEVSESMEGSGATLSSAAITVQLGAGAVNFNKADAGTADAAKAQKPNDGHLLPIDELTALIDGTAPAAQAASAATAQQAASSGPSSGKAVSDAVKAAAGAGTPAAAAKAAKAAVAETKLETGMPGQPAPVAPAAETSATTAPETAPETPAATAEAAIAAAAPADASGPALAADPAPAADPTQTPDTQAAQVADATAPQPAAEATALAGVIGQAAAQDGADKDIPATGVAAANAQEAKVPPLVAADKAAAQAAKAQAAANQTGAEATKQAQEGNPAATQMAHQAASAQEAAKAASPDSAQDKSADTADFKTHVQGASTQAVGQQMTARAIDQATASAFGQQMGSGTQRDPSLALTPEQLVGQSAGSSHDAVAAGLNNLRGQPSFMESMSLLGGRPSATLAANVAQQFNMQVSKAVMAGEQQITVRLDPAELGRLEVKLHFTKDGEIRAKVAAERPETLQLLQRDAKGLEKALTSGGQRIEQGGISFSLDNSDQQSAGRAFAEAVQQEKMRADLAARSATSPDMFAGAQEEQIPLENILPHVSAASGVDISV